MVSCGKATHHQEHMDDNAHSDFVGTFERKLDSKKRFSVPSAWLQVKEGGEKFCVRLHIEGQFVEVVLPEVLRRENAAIREISSGQIKKDMLRFMTHGVAHDVETDGQGRILLTADQCLEADLQATVVCVGLGDRFEIWNAGRYAAEKKAARERFLAARQAARESNAAVEQANKDNYTKMANEWGY